MDQVRIGCFLKELRREKGWTQERLGEELGVSSRSISRWENGVNMPDFDLLIELARLYDVGIEDLLGGERKDVMNRQTEQTLHQVAEYTNHEKESMKRRIHTLAWLGAAAWGIMLALRLAGAAEEGVGEKIYSFAAGAACAMAIIMVFSTGGQAMRLRAFKMRLLRKEKQP